jgi:hypothetical protein
MPPDDGGAGSHLDPFATVFANRSSAACPPPKRSATRQLRFAMGVPKGSRDRLD